MDPRERNIDLTEVLNIALDGRQAEIWTALPAILQAFDPATQTATLQIALLMQVRNEAGAVAWTAPPPLIFCPVQFPSGGGFTLTFPMAIGDEGLVVFAQRCIDQWWQAGGTNNQQIEFRMHDISDGFFLPGFRSKPRALAGVSTTTAQLRSDDGTTFVELSEGQVQLYAAAGQTYINSGQVLKAVEISDSSYQVTPEDFTIFCFDVPCTVTLLAAPKIGRTYRVKNATSGGTVTVEGSGGATIDGQPNNQLGGYGAADYEWNGAEWSVA